jgi:hypothetical protein
MCVERILPASMLRPLAAEEMGDYRHPFGALTRATRSTRPQKLRAGSLEPHDANPRRGVHRDAFAMPPKVVAGQLTPARPRVGPQAELSPLSRTSVVRITMPSRKAQGSAAARGGCEVHMSRVLSPAPPTVWA